MYRDDFDNEVYDTETFEQAERSEDFKRIIQNKLHDIIIMLKRIIHSVRAKAKEIYAEFLRIVSGIIKQLFKVIEQILDFVRGISELIETVIKGLDKINSTLNSLRV